LFNKGDKDIFIKAATKKKPKVVSKKNLPLMNRQELSIVHEELP